MLKRFWRAETGFFLGIWLFLMVGGRSPVFRDPRTFCAHRRGAPDSLHGLLGRHRPFGFHIRS